MTQKMLVYIENPAFKLRLDSIVKEVFVGINVIDVRKKHEIFGVLGRNKIDCMIIEIKHTNKGDFDFIISIKECYPSMIILIYGTRNIGIKTLRFIKLESLGLLLNLYSEKEIIDELQYRFSLKF